MKRTMVFAVLIFGLFSSTQAFADLNAGLLAYESRDFKKAIKLLVPVALDGDQEAQYIIGRMHEFGLGTQKDQEQAGFWYRKAAIQGHARAQLRLGRILQIGIRENFKEGAGWFRRAAQQGYAPAQVLLSGAYILGNGVPQSYSLSFVWARKAAYRGNKLGQNQLAMHYFQGTGVAKNRTLALMWMILARRNGHKDGRMWVEHFSKETSRKEIREAKRLADLW